MKKFEIGSKVRVVDSGQTYATYEAWVIEHAHKYHERWYRTSKNHNLPNEGEIGVILASGGHGDYENRMLYLVSIEGTLYIIGHEGLEQNA